MPTLIKNGQIVADDWTFVTEVGDAPVASRSIVPAAYALANAGSLFGAGREIGFWLEGDAEPNELTGLLDRIALIAIRFSTINDGRGLSIAVILRTRLGFKGELRAIGEVHEDVLHYMRRCGIDSYELPDGHDPSVALAALKPYTEYYQGSVVDPRPAFRRIARGGKTHSTV
jgi:uncharacterized protein (DUF934 family)